ncbi:XylR family transcriptional regulator [uncultured Gimesia sp.]|uniref:AraC family transcriptional regulator n=1 Tax=uncultured Gimesia sp. TaxID=1678688 RepID=UPI0030DA095F|tara:strand:+ start:198981 stop:200180 length:1200 start_codon:yes stop_codon:yes gene_type:complete
MQRKIALLIVPSSDNQIRMIRGVMDYAKEFPHFRITKNAAIPYIPWSMVNQINCDGIIAYAETEEQIDQLASLNIPAVNLTLHTQPVENIPVVHSDNALIGQLAAEHLMSAGLRRFVFIGHSPWHHNQLRRDGFTNSLAQHGFDTHQIDVEFESVIREDLSTRRINQADLLKAIAAIPTPFGVFAAHDEFSYEVVEACKALNRVVPYDVAVIGVNDYKLICESTEPPLSSIAQNSERIGYLAAELVDQLINGAEPTASPVYVTPDKLIVRRSSDFLALEDSDLIPIVQYIREECHRPITVTDLAERFNLGRKTLDERFKASLGHTVSKEIRLSRIRTARELLTTTQMRIIDVGFSCGFDSTSGFVRAFRESTGYTPGQIRLGENQPRVEIETSPNAHIK